MGNKSTTNKQPEKNNEKVNSNNDLKKSDEKSYKLKKIDEDKCVVRMQTGQNGMGFEDFVQEQENYQQFSNIIANAVKVKNE
ncbi:unnamed protein product [Paramecium primaurelia]|uniref:Uncharacterized protein n=1 Tax=Paramecium primaurelia TaxID=5886 RepID=A0A8S1PRY8_PARPR|nr:unnamed protein product [Paramecium primaurelia]CAD8105754.1 unnamed protein product [Paramecium primaurelia]